MEMKVWVDGVQRVVCGVTEATTCQEVVIALAQAIGRTGRYTLMEKWRDTERLLVPYESPVASLNTWGQYAGDVQFVLQRTGPALSDSPAPDSLSHRGLHRQSLPLMTKLRPPGDHALRRREPRRKSLTFTGVPRTLKDILSASVSQSRLSEGRGQELKHLIPITAVQELKRLLSLQRETLLILKSKAAAFDSEMRLLSEKRAGSCEGVAEEVARLEKQVQRSRVEIEEEEFWSTELHIEQESERQLQERLQELDGHLRLCQDDLDRRMTSLRGVEAGLEMQRSKELRASRKTTEEDIRARLKRVRAELKAQDQHTKQLEHSSTAVHHSLEETCRRLQDSHRDLELLTKELRQVNLQQFIKQTGTKVTVLPVEPSEDQLSSTAPHADLALFTGSLKRPSSFHSATGSIRGFPSPVSSVLNPEGIYV